MQMSDTKPVILLVDDDPDILTLVSMRLNASGYEVRAVGSGHAALAALATARPKLVITDLKMDGMDGMALFEAIHAAAPSLPVIILTAHGTIPEAVAATKRGVFGFLPKPLDNHALLEQVAQALKLSAGIGVVGAASADEEWRGAIVSASSAMEDVLSRARLVAQSDASVFIYGASGTGKELVARAIHLASARAAGPFVAVNCAAIPEALMESELFGHKKGAFTGAVYDHKGLVQSASGGTLFLDEIGDMPLPLQAKLLRVLQERQVRSVGSTLIIDVDMRVISATHRSLEQSIADRQFREDLYYRLNVVALTIPPLARRPEDIVPLALHFLKQVAARYCKDVNGFAPEALEQLIAAPWPGNVRQLQNVVEQTVALATNGVIPASSVQSALNDRASELTSLDQAKRAFERDYLVRILKITQGNVAQAAKFAQRNRTEFYKLLERHGLEPGMFKSKDA
jgi:two-component system response regulator GlrR